MGLSASKSDPSTQTNTTRLLCVVLTLPTQQLALVHPKVRRTNKNYENHMLICFKSRLFIAVLRAEISRAAQGNMIQTCVVLIHHIQGHFRLLTLY